MRSLAVRPRSRDWETGAIALRWSRMAQNVRGQGDPRERPRTPNHRARLVRGASVGRRVVQLVIGLEALLGCGDAFAWRARRHGRGRATPTPSTAATARRPSAVGALGRLRGRCGRRLWRARHSGSRQRAAGLARPSSCRSGGRGACGDVLDDVAPERWSLRSVTMPRRCASSSR